MGLSLLEAAFEFPDRVRGQIVFIDDGVEDAGSRFPECRGSRQSCVRSCSQLYCEASGVLLLN